MGHGDLRQGGLCSSAAAGCRRATALPVDLLAELPGGPWVALGGAMLTVEASVDSVERRLAAWELSRPCCSGTLAGGGGAPAGGLPGPGVELRGLTGREGRPRWRAGCWARGGGGGTGRRPAGGCCWRRGGRRAGATAADPLRQGSPAREPLAVMSV